MPTDSEAVLYNLRLPLHYSAVNPDPLWPRSVSGGLPAAI